MGQLNIYVPDDIEENIRKLAKKKEKSISKYLSDMFVEFQEGRRNQWQKDFFKTVVGHWSDDKK